MYLILHDVKCWFLSKICTYMLLTKMAKRKSAFVQNMVSVFLALQLLCYLGILVVYDFM